MEVALDTISSTNQRRSFSSEDDTESIHSVQAKETDVVQDSNSDDYDDFSSASTLELEYEVASDSEDAAAAQYEVLLGTGPDGVSSSGEDDMHVTAAIAVVLCDTSLEAWATDCEDSDDTTAYNDSLSSAASTSGRGADFWTCVQCNGRNDQPQVRYCDKCFQRCWQCKTRKIYNCFPLCTDCYKVRKNLFPPRPRGARKRKMERQAAEEAQITRKRRASNSCDEPPVKLTALQHCLSGLSQDSGLGSSQEIPGLNFDKIIMPIQLQRGVKRTRTCSSSIESDTDPLNSYNTDAKHCTVSKQARLELPMSTVINDVKNLPSTSKAVIVNAAIVSVETTKTISSDHAVNAIVRTSSVVGSKEISLNSIPTKSIDIISSSNANDVATSSEIFSNATSLNTRALSDTDIAVASCSKVIQYSESERRIAVSSKVFKRFQTEASEFERDVAASAKDVKLKENARDSRTRSTSDLGSVDLCSKDAPSEGSLPELKELCMICNDSPKNAIFLHGKIAHLCCCYKCAMKTWRISKRCPMCNCKVKNVVKVYST